MLIRSIFHLPDGVLPVPPGTTRGRRAWRDRATGDARPTCLLRNDIDVRTRRRLIMKAVQAPDLRSPGTVVQGYPGSADHSIHPDTAHVQTSASTDSVLGTRRTTAGGVVAADRRTYTEFQRRSEMSDPILSNPATVSISVLSRAHDNVLTAAPSPSVYAGAQPGLNGPVSSRQRHAG